MSKFFAKISYDQLCLPCVDYMFYFLLKALTYFLSKNDNTNYKAFAWNTKMLFLSVYDKYSFV